MRLFIAFGLPPGIKKAVAGIQSDLKKTGAHVSWVRPEGMHLTLKFLGEVPEARVPEIEDALENAARGTGALSVTIGGLGAFPEGKRPRVIWVGVHSLPEKAGGGAGSQTRDDPSGDKLGGLARRIEEECERLGFDADNRPFRPHLTLGRVRSPRGREALMAGLKTPLQKPLGTCRFEELDLMQSQLSPGGARYSIIRKISLN